MIECLSQDVIWSAFPVDNNTLNRVLDHIIPPGFDIVEYAME